MQKVSISIVIPAYNEASRIGACLDEIAQQTIAPDEVIVVDNNSTDDTASIAKKYPFVRVIRETKQGIAHAHYAGFEASKSNFITRIDADSILPTNFIETVQDFYQSSQNTRKCLRGSGYARNLRTNRLNNFIGDSAFRATDFMTGFKPVWGPCMVVPHLCWDKVKDGLCDEKPGTFDDLELGLHLHEAGFEVIWRKDLRVGITLRHISSLKNFMRYNLRTPRTLRNHGSNRWLLAYVATLSFAVLYPLVRTLNNKQ